MAVAYRPGQEQQIVRQTLTPKQQKIYEIVKNTKPGHMVIIGYGGAAGGGKTRLIVELALDLASDFPGAKILVGRKDYSDLRTTTMDQFFMHVPAPLIVRRNATEHWVDIRLEGWPEGVYSRITFRELKDYMGLGSEEYTAVLIDEAGEVPANSARMLLGRMRAQLPEAVKALRRGPCDFCQSGFVENTIGNLEQCDVCHGLGHFPDGKPPKYVFLAASNPWPGWFEQWFVKEDIPEEARYMPSMHFHFVPALPGDNPHLPKDYEARLRAVWPADWVQRMMEGRWDAFIGQVYPAFSTNIHAYRAPLPPIQEWKRIIGGLDFGGQNPYDHFTAAMVAIELKSGRIIRVAEFEERGQHIDERLITFMLEQEGKWCNKYTGARIHWVGDRTQGWGLRQFRRLGFRIKESVGMKDSRERGIAKVARYLDLDKSGYPGSFYLPALTKFPERMIAYRYEEPSSDDSVVKREPIRRGDDLLDADRYMHELLGEPYGGPASGQFPTVAPRRTQ